MRNTVKRNGIELIFTETYAPILNERGEVIKVLKIAFNITDYIAGQSENTEAPPDNVYIEAE